MKLSKYHIMVAHKLGRDFMQALASGLGLIKPCILIVDRINHRKQEV